MAQIGPNPCSQSREAVPGRGVIWIGFVALACLGLVAALAAGRGGSRIDAQLRAVRAARFTPRPILNRAEFKRFAWLEAWARDTPYRVFAQVSYGEILACTDDDAFAAINAKRCDMLIADARGMPVAAVEYQGSGHWQGDAKGRDAVKRAALASAGIALVEVLPKHDRREVAAMADRAAAAHAARG